MIRPPPKSPLFPYTTLFRSGGHEIGPQVHAPRERLDRLATRMPAQRPAVVQLVRQHELSGQEVPPLMSEGDQHLEALEQRAAGGAHEPPVVRRGRIDVAEGPRRSGLVQLAAGPPGPLRVAPRAQPTR